jgi:hypothetical protein
MEINRGVIRIAHQVKGRRGEREISAEFPPNFRRESGEY